MADLKKFDEIDKKNSSKASCILTWFGFLMILGIAASLRLYQVSQAGWYNDEGTLINIAQNMNLGRLEYLGIQNGFFLSGRQPLFIGILALIFRFTGPGILPLRTLTASFGIINTGLVFFVMRRYGYAIALLCSLSLAIFPKAIIYSRFGFSYNLIATVALLSYWALQNYSDTPRLRSALLAAFTIGLGLTSELVTVALIPVLILVVLWKRSRDLIWVVPVLVLPLAAYLATIWVINPQNTLYDLRFAFFRVSANSLPVQFMTILIDSGFLFQDWGFYFGLVGLFLSPFAQQKKLSILYLFLAFVIITRTNPIGDLASYYLIPLYPFFAIGIGLLLSRFFQALVDLVRDGVDRFRDRFRSIPLFVHRWMIVFGNLTFVILFFLSPLVFSISDTLIKVNSATLKTGMDPILLDPQEAISAAAYINEHIQPGDLVLASPAIAWAIHGDVTDYQISLAASGVRTIHFPGDIPRSRFRFNPDYQIARFILMDNIWLNWAWNAIPDLSHIQETLNGMQVVYETEHFTVYKRP